MFTEHVRRCVNVELLVSIYNSLVPVEKTRFDNFYTSRYAKTFCENSMNYNSLEAGGEVAQICFFLSLKYYLMLNTL